MSAINLPADAYLHQGAPTEWWWHIGTLFEVGGQGRKFGFEINAAGFAEGQGPDLPPACFTQIMLSDPASQNHYKNTVKYDYDPGWAESGMGEPWFAKIGNPADLHSPGWVYMQSAGVDIWSLHVQASVTDVPTGVVVAFDLQMNQPQTVQPMLHWGTGWVPVYPKKHGPLNQNNYYYSFTALQVTGTVRMGEETIQVSGVTWMDHEWGAFSAATKWIMQDIQLSNGVYISNSSAKGFDLQPGVKTPTYATVLGPLGFSTLLTNTSATPSDPWVGSDGTTYYLTWDVEISETSSFHLSAIMENQLFPDSQRSIYEGAATLAVTGTLDGESVTGTAWIEQALAPLNEQPPAPRRGHHRALGLPEPAL